MTATTDWPYDAEQNHPISERTRIPIVGTIYPQWRYHVALVIAPDGLWPAIEPTEQEVDQLASYLQFWLQKFYFPRWIEQMRARPFDIDGGTVTRTFLKRPDGTWCWRQCTWDMGPALVPSFTDAHQCHSLVDLLDTRVETIATDSWAAWKAEHPDIFPPKENDPHG